MPVSDLYSLCYVMLVKHEAIRYFPYDDTTGRTPRLTTGGKITIGIGRNLTDRGLSADEIDYLFKNDYYIAHRDASDLVGQRVFEALTINRQAVMIDMAFNLGKTKLSKFTATLRAVVDGRYNDAKRHLLRSLWAKQVGSRAKKLADMMEKG